MKDPFVDIVNLILEENLQKAVNYYGLEGCEEAIYRVYSQNPSIRQRFLAILHKKYRKNS